MYFITATVILIGMLSPAVANGDCEKVYYRCVVEPVDEGRNFQQKRPRFAEKASACSSVESIGQACDRATDKCLVSHKYCRTIAVFKAAKNGKGKI